MTARITRLSATKPSIVTKTYSLVNEALTKSTVADVYAGSVAQVEVSDLQAFADVLAGLSHSQCLVYGIAPGASLELVTERAWAQAGKPVHQVARTKDAFRWPDGPGILMLDYDPAGNCEPHTRDQLVEAVRAACPGLADAAMLWWPSASSNIENTDTGEILRGVRGQRIYLMVQDARDIPRAGKALCERLWAAGAGHFEVSKSGALLERALFDTSVWQTNRIDFAAGARCFEPLRQQRGEPVLIAGDVQVVDTVQAIPDPDAATAALIAEHKGTERAACADEARGVRELWRAQRIEELIPAIVKKTGITPDQARARATHVVERVTERGELFADWVLTVKSPDGQGAPLKATVGEILDAPYRWHGCVTKDPLEPDYDGGRWVGKLYLIGARPSLYSMAHGGKSYRMLRQLERIEIVRGKLAETVDSLVEVLRRSPDIFDYGTEMATPAGSGKMLRLEKDNLRYIAAGLTQFWRWHKMPDGSQVEVLENPPIDVSTSVLALRGRRGLKPLDAVISAPLMRPDGSVMALGGYDPKTRLLLDVTEPLQDIPERPSPDELDAAWTRLWAPFEAFPFVGPVDRAVMLCALLTAVQRPILGTAPAIAFDAPRQGTGKTLLGECCAILATGERPNAWPHIEKNEEETRKRLLTALRSGARVLLWDNIVGSFDSPALAALLTSDVYTDRVLGVSTSEAYPNRLLVLLTGNNFTPSGELPRRVLTCRLDAQSERPFTRSFSFNPAVICLAHRQALVAAVLTLLRGYAAIGRPSMSDASVGSFNQWDADIRQAVLWIGADVAPTGLLGDPLDSILSRAESDPVDDAHGELMRAWLKLFGDRYVTARDLLDVHRKARKFGERPTEAELRLSDALEEFGHGRELSAKTVGRVLMYRRDRPVGGLQVVRSGTKNRDDSWAWRVRTIEAGEKAPTAGFGGFGGFGSTLKNSHGDPLTHRSYGKVSPQTPSYPQDADDEEVIA